MSDFLRKLKADDFRFGQREKLWVIGGVIMTILIFGNNLIFRPQGKAMIQARSAFIQARNDLLEIEAQKPDVESRRTYIRQLQTQVGLSYKELEKLEKGLLYSQDQDLLLDRLVADRRKYQMQINAVEPLKEEPSKAFSSGEKGAPQAALYKQLQVNIDASASYDNLISYVTALENEGPYQKVRGIRVEMDKEGKTLPRAKIFSEILLSDTSVKKSELREKVISMVGEDLSDREAKDPFLAQERPREEETLTGVELTGIFGVGNRLTALIDGNAYQEGDVIQGKRIVKIHSDRVVFEEGNKRYFLYERQSTQ